MHHHVDGGKWEVMFIFPADYLDCGSVVKEKSIIMGQFILYSRDVIHSGTGSRATAQCDLC